MDEAHRNLAEHRDDIQAGNTAWWTSNPMTYDWHRTIDRAPLTAPWFDEMDRRWVRDSYPYLSRRDPFDKIMPTDLRASRVLEIGCGMGLHTQHLVARGAHVTAVDLTAPAARATAARIRMRKLDATVLQADAEALPFPDNTFDFVWSWGVIHHSSHTARIVREISRVLKPDGETRIMVYNRSGRMARFALAWYYMLGREYRTMSSDEVLWAHSDGFIARHYTRDGLDDLLRGFFHESTTEILGQDVEVVPLPSRLRAFVIPMISTRRREAVASKHGGFLFATANRPLS